MTIHINNGYDVNDPRHKECCPTCRGIAKREAFAKMYGTGVQQNEHVKDLLHAQQDSLWRANHDEPEKPTTALCMRCLAPIPFEHQLCEECHKVVNLR